MSYNNNPKAALLKFKQKINSHKFNPITLPNPVFSKKRTHTPSEEPKQSPSKKQKIQNEKIDDKEVLHAKFDTGDFLLKKFESKGSIINSDFLVEKKKPLNFKDEFKAQAGKLFAKGIFGNTKSSNLVSNDPAKKSIKKGYDPYSVIHPLHEKENSYHERPPAASAPVQKKEKNKNPKLLSRQLFYDSDDDDKDVEKTFEQIETSRIEDMKKEKDRPSKTKIIGKDISGQSLTICELCKVLTPLVESIKTEFEDGNELYEINNGWFEHTASLSGHIENLTRFATYKLIGD